MSTLSIKKIINNFHGINIHLLYKAFIKLGLAFNKIYIKNNKIILNTIDYKNIISFIEVSFLLNSLLKDKIFINIRKLRLLKGYKGMRHIYNLPVQGQRTKTNARTRKKKKKKI